MILNLVESAFGVTVDIRGIEQYVRLEKALKNIGPQNIYHITIVYTYRDPVAKNFYAADPLLERINDLEFYTSLFPYLPSENKIIISDDGNKNKHEILQEIAKKVPPKSIVLLFFAGHGHNDGSLYIGSYKNECKVIGNKFAKDHPQAMNYTPAQIAETWTKYYQPGWQKNACENENYLLSPNELMRSDALKKSKVVFFNDSCFSGAFNGYLGNPLSMVVYAAGKGETAVTFSKTMIGTTLGTIKPGGFLTNLLKMRLGVQDGCQLDGTASKGLGGARDLVLNLFEWTTNLNFTWLTPHILGNEKRTTGVEYNFVNGNLPVEDLQAISIPVQVYTGEQCSKFQPEATRQWGDISTQTESYAKNLTVLGGKYINDIFSGMIKTSTGDYQHPFKEQDESKQ